MKKLSILFACLVFLISNLSFADCHNEISKARAEIYKENYLSAKNILEKSIDFADDINLLAEIYSLLAHYSETSDEANKYYKKILALQENTYTDKARLSLAKNYFCKSNYSEAKKYLKQILQNSTSNSFKETLYWSGQTCFAMNNYDNCINYLKNYLKTGKDNTKIELAFLNIGTSYFKLNNYPAALNHFKNLNSSNKNKNFSSYILYMIGLCEEKLSQFSNAIVAYKKVINQYPYSNERFLAESQLVSLAEKGHYDSSVKMPEIKIDSDKRYIVQLAAFLNREKARKSKSEFKKKGYDTFVYEKIVKGTRYFAVGLGPYRTETEAQYIQNKLKKNSISSFIYKKP